MKWLRMDISSLYSPRASLPRHHPHLHHHGGRKKQRPWYRWKYLAALLLPLFLLYILVNHFSQSSIAQVENPPDFDVVGLNLKPTCVTRESILALNKFLKPRHIFIITPKVEQCQKLHALAGNVRCTHEDSVVPDFTWKWVYNRLQLLYPELKGNEFQMGRTPAGWYLQQILKLAAAQAFPDLSDYYVIWDFDMILLKQIPIFYTSKHAPYNSDSPSSIMTVVNIGGATARGYELAYAALFNREMERAPDNTSFVTHWIVVRKQLMLEFLRDMSPTDARYSWIDHILSSLPRDDLFQGFSEYASYVSWVRQHYPHTQYIMPRKTWLRQPVGGGLGIWFARLAHPDGLCCPSAVQIGVARALGYQYGGFEIGHHPVCRWTDPEFKDSYGL